MSDSLRVDLAQEAFREGNLVAVGVNPTAAETAEAKKILDRFLTSLIGTEIGEHFVALPVPLPTDWRSADPGQKGRGVYPDPQHPKAGRRLIMSNTEPHTAEMPATPGDGARMAVVSAGATSTVTLSGNGSFIDPGGRGLEQEVVLTLSDGDTYEWMYRADLAQWVLTDTNVSGDPISSLAFSPFPPEFDGLLITGCAARLQARFGNDTRSGTAEEYRRMLRVAKARYSQSVQSAVSHDVPLNRDVVDSEGAYFG